MYICLPCGLVYFVIHCFAHSVPVHIVCLYTALTGAEANITKQAGIRIISIGVGSGYDLDELNGMASDPISHNVFTVQDFEALTSILTIIRETIQSEYFAWLTWY